MVSLLCAVFVAVSDQTLALTSLAGLRVSSSQWHEAGPQRHQTPARPIQPSQPQPAPASVKLPPLLWGRTEVALKSPHSVLSSKDGRWCSKIQGVRELNLIDHCETANYWYGATDRQPTLTASILISILEIYFVAQIRMFFFFIRDSYLVDMIRQFSHNSTYGDGDVNADTNIS